MTCKTNCFTQNFSEEISNFLLQSAVKNPSFVSTTLRSFHFFQVSNYELRVTSLYIWKQSDIEQRPDTLFIFRGTFLARRKERVAAKLRLIFR